MSIFSSVHCPLNNFTFPCTHSISNNAICGLYPEVVGGKATGKTLGTYTAEAINTLCEALKSSSITKLKCAVPSLSYTFCSAPYEHFHFACTRDSLGRNSIRVDATTAASAQHRTAQHSTAQHSTAQTVSRAEADSVPWA